MADENDWLCICISCGNRIMAGADFKESCPVCHGSRWLCHWQKAAGPSDKMSQDKASARLERRKTEVSPLKLADFKGDMASLPKPEDTKSGPQPRSRQPDLITELADKGMGAKRIAEELRQRGVAMSYRTVARKLARQKQGQLLQIRRKRRTETDITSYGQGAPGLEAADGCCLS